MRTAALFCSFLMVIASAVISFPVLADENSDESKKQEIDLPWDKAAVTASYFLPEFDSNVRIDSKALGIGTIINFENTLGLDESLNIWSVNAFYRFGNRHRVSFSYHDLSRDSTRILLEDIKVGDYVFTVGSIVNSVFDLSVYKGAYSYSFFQNEHFDVGALLGFYLMDTTIGIEAAGIGKESNTLTAPLPVFGLAAQFAFTPKLIFKQSVEFFWITIDSYSGRIIDWNMALEYTPFKYLGLGIGYEVFRFEINADNKEFAGGDFLGTFDFAYHGLSLYLKLCF